MNHLIKLLVEVDEKLGDADNRICNGMSLAAATNLNSEEKVAVQEYRDARQTLQLTTEQLREKWDQVARARDATINLLTELRDRKNTLSSYEVVLYQQGKEEREFITQVIGQLDGSLPGEEDDEH